MIQCVLCYKNRPSPERYAILLLIVLISSIFTTACGAPSLSTRLGKSGVEGKVEIGPTCGNQPQRGNANCADKPYETQLTVTDINGEIVVQSKSDADGFFHISLLPGEYVLVPKPTGFLFVSPIPFSVNPNDFTYIPVLYHTNIQ